MHRNRRESSGVDIQFWARSKIRSYIHIYIECIRNWGCSIKTNSICLEMKVDICYSYTARHFSPALELTVAPHVVTILIFTLHGAATTHYCVHCTFILSYSCAFVLYLSPSFIISTEQTHSNVRGKTCSKCKVKRQRIAISQMQRSFCCSALNDCDCDNKCFCQRRIG